MKLTYTRLLKQARLTTAQEIASSGAEIVWGHSPVSDRTGTPTWRPIVVRDGGTFIPGYTHDNKHILFDMLQGDQIEPAIEHAKAAIRDITGAMI